MSDIDVPDFSLVILVGASGAGKSTFAARNFLPTEVLSSDAYRGLVCDDERNFEATHDAFAAMADMAGRRLGRRRMVVVDATNLEPVHRARWLDLARSRHAATAAVVLDVPAATLQARRIARGSGIDARALKAQADAVRRSKGELRREGWQHVHALGEDEAATVRVRRVPLWTDRRDLTGPFDVVGDVHGCADELEDLLVRLGYEVSWSCQGPRRASVSRPVADGRRLAFVGDYVDRGPRNLDAVRLVMAAVEAGGVAVAGNHDERLSRWLKGRPVKASHGLDLTLAEVEADPAFRRDLGAFLDGLRGHAWLDGGRLCLTHAAIREDMVGGASAAARDYCVFGPPKATGPDGRERSVDWTVAYRGPAAVAYGHVVVGRPDWVNGTIGLDTGCVFGGALSALRWPERELVSVPARRAWYDYGKPLPEATERPGQQLADDALDFSELASLAKARTLAGSSVKLSPEGVAGALELLATRCVAPRLLAYVPPTMSPVATSRREGLLEHPDEAFGYFRAFGGDVVCERKHMGSRAVLALCATPGAALRRFGREGALGTVYSRTGQPFFAPSVEVEILERLRDDVARAGLWDALRTDWLLLDCEVMPWSLKAMDLVRRQYAPIGAIANSVLGLTVEGLRAAAARGVDVGAELAVAEERAGLVTRYDDAWRNHVAPVRGLEGVKVAPFHVLACEGRMPVLDGDHVDFHLALADRLADASDLFARTDRVVVDPSDEASRERGVAFFDEVVASGGEGIVVKPRKPVAHEVHGRAQPALKVRGKEYLRVVYGPEYDRPANVARLRDRAIGPKRALALREDAVGLHGLARFVEGAPLREVLAGALGVLALERQRIDARL